MGETMDRREMITGLGAALAGAGCATTSRARDPLPAPTDRTYLAELERDLNRIRATQPSAELAATLEAEGLGRQALGQWLSALALAMAFRSHGRALEQEPGFMALVMREAGSVAESLLTVGGWLERMPARRRRELAAAQEPDQAVALLNGHLLQRGGPRSDRLDRLDGAFYRNHRRMRRSDPDRVVTGLLGRFDEQVVKPTGGSGGRTWSAAGDTNDPAFELHNQLDLGGGLAMTAGGIGIGVGFCMGCVNSISWNVGCYVGVALLIAGAAMIIRAMVLAYEINEHTRAADNIVDG
jgi:hypothetical protein